MSLNKRDALLVLLVGIFSIFFGKKITLSRDEPASTTSNNISQRRAGTETGDTLYDWAQWNSFVQNNAVERGYDVIGGATIRGGRAARDIRAGEHFIRLDLDAAFSMRTIESDPVLREALGFNSQLYREVIPSAIEAQNLEYEHPWEHAVPLALLHHISLPEKSSRYWGYLEELRQTDLSAQPAFHLPEFVFEKFPELFNSEDDKADWITIDWDWQEMYTIMSRRSRRHLEINFPDLFGPHILVRGQPILSDDNQLWASQLFYSRYWGQDLDLFGDGKSSTQGAMLPIMDSLNYAFDSPVDCGVSGGPKEGGNFFSCWTKSPIQKGDAIVWKYSETTDMQTAIRSWGFYHPNMLNGRPAKPSAAIQENRETATVRKAPVLRKIDENYVETGDALYDWAAMNPFINNVNGAVTRGFNEINGQMIRGTVAARDIEAGEEYIRLELDAAISLRTIDKDPVLQNVLGTQSEYFNEILPVAYAATNMKFDDRYEYILPLAILYHASLPGRESPWWGYISEMLDADLSYHPSSLTPEDMFENFPDVFDNDGFRDVWMKQDDDWVEAYYIISRRTRRFLEKNYPDIFGPQILVRGQPILSQDNQLWACQLFVTRFWGEDYDIFSNNRIANHGAMLPVMDSYNYAWDSAGGHLCGVSDGRDENGNYYYRCKTSRAIKKGSPLRFQYSVDVCRSDAIRTWGFFVLEMPLCDHEHHSRSQGGDSRGKAEQK